MRKGRRKWETIVARLRFLFNSLMPWQPCRHLADDIFKGISWMNISLGISLEFVPKARIINIQAFVQIMARRLPGHKPLSEPIMVNLLTHICIIHPQWVKYHIALRESIASEKDVWTGFVLLNKVVLHMYLKIGIQLVRFCLIIIIDNIKKSLQWRHNGCIDVSNHQPHDCLLNRLFRLRSKKTSKLPVTGLGGGNSPATGEFPVQRPNNAENVSIWWRHHDESILYNSPFICGNSMIIQPLFHDTLSLRHTSQYGVLFSRVYSCQAYIHIRPELMNTSCGCW